MSNQAGEACSMEIGTRKHACYMLDKKYCIPGGLYDCIVTLLSKTSWAFMMKLRV